MATALTELLSTTLYNYQKKLVDNIHKSNAVLYALQKANAVKKETGGESIITHLMYAKNTSVTSYSDYDTLSITPQTTVGAAKFEWKQYAAMVTISGAERKKNQGSTYKIIDLLDAKVKQAEESLKEDVVAGIFSDGTGNSGKDLTGLEAMVSDSGTYGGIDSSTETWWQAYVDDNGAVDTALTLDDMRTAFNTASKGGADTPDLIVTTQALYEKYEGFFTAVNNGTVPGSFSTPSKGVKRMADGGFQTLQFKGTPIVWDEQAPAKTMYFLNTRHMKLVVHKDTYFAPSKFYDREEKDALAAKILFMGNLTCDRRKSFAKLTHRT